MNKFLLIVLVALMTSCGGKTNGIKAGTDVSVFKRCISASDENSYDEMTKKCNHKDEIGLQIMESKGLVRILEIGESGKVLETGISKTKIRLNDLSEVWVSNDFIR